MGVDKLKSLLTLSPRGAVASRSRRLIFGGALALAALSGCNGNDPNNNNPDGGAGSGAVDGGGGTGAGGGGGSTPSCAGLENDLLAYKGFDMSETGSVAVNNPSSDYDGVKLDVASSNIFAVPTGIGLQKVTYDNYQAGYSAIGDFSGVRPMFLDSAQPYIWNGTSCVPNLVNVNEIEGLSLTTPQGHFMTGFEVKEGVESMGAYELEAENTRMQVTGVTALNQNTDIIFGQSKPVPHITVTRDENDLAVIDVSQTTDENKAVWDRLSFSFQGVPTESHPTESGKLRSLSPVLSSSITGTTVGLSQSVADDTIEETYNIPEKPEISNLAIDCSSTGGQCGDDGLVYPVNFTVTDAISCTATPESLGIGTDGSTSPVILNGTSGTFNYTTGDMSGDEIKITVDCNGPGGYDSEFTQFLLI